MTQRVESVTNTIRVRLMTLVEQQNPAVSSNISAVTAVMTPYCTVSFSSVYVGWIVVYSVFTGLLNYGFH